MYIGSWDIDDALTFYCNTHDVSTGAETDADAVPSYRVYEDETETPLLTGNMAKLDDGNTTGHYSEQISLSSANGFERGKCYSIRITATVGGVTASKIVTFQVNAQVSIVSVDLQSTINSRSLLSVFKILESQHSGAWSFDVDRNLTYKDESGNTLAVVNIGNNSQTKVS